MICVHFFSRQTWWVCRMSPEQELPLLDRGGVSEILRPVGLQVTIS
jgi:hypothetical protein